MKKVTIAMTIALLLTGCSVTPSQVDKNTLCRSLSLEDSSLQAYNISQDEVRSELNYRGIDPDGLQCGRATARAKENHQNNYSNALKRSTDLWTACVDTPSGPNCSTL